MVQGTDGSGDESRGEGERARDRVTNPESEKGQEVKESPPAKLKPKPKPPVEVRPIEKQGKALLVEWQDGDGLHRSVVRRADVVENEIDPDKLAQGNPYGRRWSDEVLGVTPELEQELYRRGIWTKRDLLAQSQQVHAAAMQVLVGPVIKSLLKFAKEQEV